MQDFTALCKQGITARNKLYSKHELMREFLLLVQIKAAEQTEDNFDEKVTKLQKN